MDQRTSRVEGRKNLRKRVNVDQRTRGLDIQGTSVPAEQWNKGAEDRDD